MAKIQSIYRYPIKGLTPERLDRTVLRPGQTVPGDRLYAIENGPSGFDVMAPGYLAKTHFLMLMKNERLATLRSAFDQDTHVLTIETPTLPSAASGGRLWERRATAELRTAEGRAAIERFFAGFCADELRGPPKILNAPGHSFSDVARKVVSIINLASVAAVEAMVGTTVNPLRFRGNIYVDGWPAWSELDLVGRELTIGQVGLELKCGQAVRLKVVKRIVRCAATNVDPDTALRDLNIPQTLMRHLDHADCGIYAEVVSGGDIAEADEIELA
ncbi:MAG TPA: MOSC N-terminal beta barrel domain-containing protein [Xanthobacteraceae bacterium]|nr:MOSC N-terminal beta barrel domain-containing protein [Xanthobacteraceae bacterium]